MATLGLIATHHVENTLGIVIGQQIEYLGCQRARWRPI
jgi:hypothetical protein